MPKITILWGEAPEPGDTAKTYEFETQDKLDGFLEGVEATEGWMGWHKVAEGYVVPESGFNAAEPDEEEEVETNTYRVRIGVTARVFTEEEFEAVDDEAAAAYVKALDPHDFFYSYSSEDGIEGDEIAFWGEEDIDNVEYENEVVLKKDGEPFSWTACDIVKDLAKLYNQRFDQGPGYSDICALVRRAFEACGGEPIGMQEG